MSKTKYCRVNSSCLQILTGVIGNKKTFRESNTACLSNYSEKLRKKYYNGRESNINLIYFKKDNRISGLYKELVTGEIFKFKKGSYFVWFQSVENYCRTDNRISHESFGVKDEKEIIRFFEKLKNEDLYEEYIKAVIALFEEMKRNKAAVLDGAGSVEDSVNVDEYVGGVVYDAQNIGLIKSISSKK